MFNYIWLYMHVRMCVCRERETECWVLSAKCWKFGGEERHKKNRKKNIQHIQAVRLNSAWDPSQSCLQSSKAFQLWCSHIAETSSCQTHFSLHCCWLPWQSVAFWHSLAGNWRKLPALKNMSHVIMWVAPTACILWGFMTLHETAKWSQEAQSGCRNPELLGLLSAHV